MYHIHMDYNGGLPPFDVEKPMMIPWASEYLQRIASSGDYLAEYKLNEHRSFLTTNTKKEVTMFSRYRKVLNPTKEAIIELQNLKLPPNTVFDGGHYKHSKISQQSRIWLFDVLVYHGQKVRLPWVERRKLLEELIPRNLKHIWISPLIEDFLSVFSDLIQKRTPRFDPIFKKAGIDRNTILPEIEGLVIKRKDGLLSFPSKCRETPNFYKLRLIDIPKNYRSWVVPVKVKEGD